MWPYLIHLQSITSSFQTLKNRCFVLHVTVLHTLKLNLMLMSNTFFFRYRLIVKRAKRCTQNQGLTRKQVKNNILLLPHQWPVHVCKVFNVYLYTYMYIYSILLDSIFSCWSLLMYENDLLTFYVRFLLVERRWYKKLISLVVHVGNAGSWHCWKYTHYLLTHNKHRGVT